MIVVQNLSKFFDKKHLVLDTINFTVRKGEIVGLLGENGAGKTTSLRIMATLLKPSSGSVLVNNYDILSQATKVRGSIGILFGGETGLYDRLTARENITYFGRLHQVPANTIKKRLARLIPLLGMEHYIDNYVATFSRGMKQKTAIARSIIHDPDIMLFDEPTMGLDITSQKIVHRFVLSCKENEKTILLSSHNIEEIQKLCDRIIIIHQGKIVRHIEKEELLAAGPDLLNHFFEALLGKAL